MLLEGIWILRAWHSSLPFHSRTTWQLTGPQMLDALVEKTSSSWLHVLPAELFNQVPWPSLPGSADESRLILAELNGVVTSLPLCQKMPEMVGT